MLRGQVYMANLSGEGSVQGGLRPVIIIQNDTGNKFSPTIICVAVTTKLSKKQLPTHVFLPKEVGFKFDSCALAEQIFTLDKSQLTGELLLTVPQKYMEQIDKALCVSFGIPVETLHKPVADMSMVKSLLSMLTSGKASKRGLWDVFVSYCKSFNLDHEQISHQFA